MCMCVRVCVYVCAWVFYQEDYECYLDTGQFFNKTNVCTLLKSLFLCWLNGAVLSCSPQELLHFLPALIPLIYVRLGNYVLKISFLFITWESHLSTEGLTLVFDCIFVVTNDLLPDFISLPHPFLSDIQLPSPVPRAKIIKKEAILLSLKSFKRIMKYMVII